MLTAVIAINLGICSLCLFVAWRLWKLQKRLSKVADTLINAERRTHSVLYGAPNAIIRGQYGTRRLRTQYGRLNEQLVKVQQLLAVVNLLLRVRDRLSGGRKGYALKKG